MGFVIISNDNDGFGWYCPLGTAPMYRSEAEDFLKEAHYSSMADREMGIVDTTDYKMVPVEELSDYIPML